MELALGATPPTPAPDGRESPVTLAAPVVPGSSGTSVAGWGNWYATLADGAAELRLREVEGVGEGVDEGGDVGLGGLDVGRVAEGAEGGGGDGADGGAEGAVGEGDAGGFEEGEEVGGGGGGGEGDGVGPGCGGAEERLELRD